MIRKKKKEWIIPNISKISIVRDTKSGIGKNNENPGNSRLQPIRQRPSG